VYLTQEHNKRVARATAQQRGDALRGGGEGKTYIKEGGRHQHVVVAERKLGRKLRHGEVVHHIDDNKRNNDPSNIEVKASQAEHAREHLAERRTRKAQTAVDLLFNNLER
jgi:ribosome-associated protein YbcJ (S4-like RNA binding protein)